MILLCVQVNAPAVTVVARPALIRRLLMVLTEEGGALWIADIPQRLAVGGRCV